MKEETKLFMKLSFRNHLLAEENFDTFQQYLQQSGMTFPQLLQQLQASKPDGSGGNADFYKIPGTEFGIRVIRRGWDLTTDEDPQELTAAHDPFDGENYGQPVAHYGKNIQVLRLQSGSPAGMPFRYNKPGGVGTEAGVQKFRQQILAAAQMPLEEYERLMRSIIELNNKGYVVDTSKSGNMLIDAERGRFNLVDLNRRSEKSSYRNSADEIPMMLIHNYEFNAHLKNDPAMRQAARQIIQKSQAAAQSTGLSMNDDAGSFQYSRELSQEPQ